MLEIFECLESRVLLHATLSGGVLTANGLNGISNTITVSQVVIAGVTFLQVNHTTSPGTAGHPSPQNFPASLVSRIIINGGDKADTLAILTPINKPSIITGKAGADSLSGGSGPDILQGFAGNDTLRGNDGNDMLGGGDGNDQLTGGRGADRLSGGNAIDAGFYTDKTAALVLSIDGLANDGTAGEADNIGTDVENLFSGSGADKITGNPSNNVLDGGGGNDLIDGASGSDTMQGNSGNDRLLAGAGADNYFGGTNTDTVDYSARATPINVSLDNNINDGTPGAEFDNVHSDVENVIGGSANDAILGSALDNRVFGGGGNDNLRGGAGEDVLVGGTGSDQLFGEDGDDLLVTKDGVVDLLSGGNGFDIATTDAGDVTSSIELFV